jgi:hypothetical protein
MLDKRFTSELHPQPVREAFLTSLRSECLGLIHFTLIEHLLYAWHIVVGVGVGKTMSG